MTTTAVLPTSRLYQVGGIAFALGNVLFIVNKLDEMNRLFLGRRMPDVISGQNPALILLGQIGLIVGYVAYFQYYAPHAGRWGKVALRFFSIGGIVLAIGHIGFITSLGANIPSDVLEKLEALFLLVAFGLLAMLIGIIWFGILNLRQPIVSHWRWLPLFTGLMGFIGFFLFSGEEINATFLVFRTLFALGLIGLGIVLWLEKPMYTPVAR